MKSLNYWQARQEQKYLAGEKKINAYYKGLKNSFEQSKKEIRLVVNDFYAKYATENGVSFTEAQKLLSKAEIGELKDFMDEAIKHMGEYNLKLNNASIKARITRYEALEKQIDAILQQLYAIDYQHMGEDALKAVYTDTYYRTWYDIDQYHGFHSEFAQVDPRMVEELIKYPFNGADFSSRLWKQKDHMLMKLTEGITTMLVQGRPPHVLAETFAKQFNSKEFDAYRLLHTESSFIIGQANLAGYVEDGVEKYQLLATLDVKTSDGCRRRDGDIHAVKDAIVGTNYPPFHNFCRTTDVPYYDDIDYSRDTKMARDPVTGEPYEVPASMNYGEWEKTFISDMDVKTDEKSGIIKIPKESKDEYYNTLLQILDKKGVEYIPVEGFANLLSPEDIIRNLGGGDTTTGSCASVGLAYIGQRQGYNVLDFRGGDSLKTFSSSLNLHNLSFAEGLSVIRAEGKSSMTVANRLVKQIETGKEYYLCAGRHAAIVRKNTDGVLQYLELQSDLNKGWTDFNGNPRYTLKTRFGCRESDSGYLDFMIDIDESNFKTDDFRTLLGYINTAAENQKKGASGYAK